MNITCDKCGSEFTLKDLKRTNGKCPKCGDVLPVTKYCHVVPEKHFWKLYSNAPLSIKIYSILWGWNIGLLTLIYGIYLSGWRPGTDPGFLSGFLPYWIRCVLDVWILSYVLLWVLKLFIRPLFFASVKGRWRSPVVATVILFLSGLILGFVFLDAPPEVVGFEICYAMLDGTFVGAGICVIGVLIVTVGLYSIPLIFKSARRWRAKCTEEELAYFIAKESGADVSSLPGHSYKNKPLAIGIAVVLIGLWSLSTTGDGFGIGEKCRREKSEWSERWIDKTIDMTLQKWGWGSVGVCEFLENPKCYLTATNDIDATVVMLCRGDVSSNMAVELLGLGVEKAKVKDEDKEILESVKADFTLYAKVFAEAKVIIQRREQLNKGDPDGALRKDFGMEDLKVIAEKLDVEMDAYLERYSEIWKFWASRRN